MEAGRRRGRGRMSRARTRTPANPRNRAAPPREDDTTMALLRQQQQIMAQMVEQQQRTNTVIELLATRLVQSTRSPCPYATSDGGSTAVSSPTRAGGTRATVGSCRATTYFRTSTGPGSPAGSRGLASNCTGDGHQRSGSCRTTPNFRRFGHGEPSRILGGV
jgi:sugar (pentulose or hexulose) kinase